jgi:hypothetical protein
MRAQDFITESAAGELAKRLPGLRKHNYDTIDALMRDISEKHKMTSKALHDLFVRKYKKTPDVWVKHKLDEKNINEDKSLNIQNEVDKFVQWSADRLHLKNIPKVELSHDTREAQDNHHTGGHTPGENTIWVYAKNRNLVDILRTVFHELVHVRQDEIGMLKPGDSYPGSPVETMADMIAGKFIKIYGEKHHYVFQ